MFTDVMSFRIDRRDEHGRQIGRQLSGDRVELRAVPVHPCQQIRSADRVRNEIAQHDGAFRRMTGDRAQRAEEIFRARNAPTENTHWLRSAYASGFATCLQKVRKVGREVAGTNGLSCLLNVVLDPHELDAERRKADI